MGNVFTCTSYAVFSTASGALVSTASGALVVGGVRDIYSIYHPILGDSFECSME